MTKGSRLTKRTKLTTKQENFCAYVAEGASATAAYIRAYDADGMKRNTIHRKAWELKQNKAIQARVEELVKHVEDETVARRVELLQVATEIVRDREVKPQDRLKAVEVVSKMQGYDAPAKSINISAHVRRTPEEMREALKRVIADKQPLLFGSDDYIELENGAEDGDG